MNAAMPECPELHFRYLSGAPHEAVMRWVHGGLMFTPAMGNKRLDMRGVTWAADNGCYSQGATFDLARYIAWLREWRRYRKRCLFAVAPDVPFNMAATLHRSRPAYGIIRALGYPVALAIQEGVEHTGVPWDDIDAVMIAGHTEFKTSQIARSIAIEGRRRGKHVHVARRNSYRAVQAAYSMGAHTVDGTFLKYAPDINAERMAGWFRALCTHEHRQQWGDDSRFSRCPSCGAHLWTMEATA